MSAKLANQTIQPLGAFQPETSDLAVIERARSANSWLSIALVAVFCLLSVGMASLPYDLCLTLVQGIVALCLIAAMSTGHFRCDNRPFDFPAATWLMSQIAACAWAYHTGAFAHSPYTSSLYNGGAFGPVLQTGNTACGVGIYLLISRQRNSDTTHALMPLIVSAIGIVTLSALEEAHNLALGTDDPRIQATFTNPNLLGAFCCVALPFAFVYSLESSVKWPIRAGRSLLAQTLAVVLLLTQSRGAIVASVVGVLFLLTSLLLPRITTHRPNLRFVFPILVGVCILICVLAFPRLLHEGRSLSDAQRETAWRGAGIIISQHPALGLGLGSYPTALEALKLKEPSDIVGGRLIYSPAVHLHAHDLILQMWVEQGVFGAALALCLVVFVCVKIGALLRRKTDASVNFLELGAVAALVATLIQNIADYTLWFAPVTLLFWYSLGLANLPESKKTSLSLSKTGQDPQLFCDPPEETFR